jgi:hypothetical protein
MNTQSRPRRPDRDITTLRRPPMLDDAWSRAIAAVLLSTGAR